MNRYKRIKGVDVRAVIWDGVDLIKVEEIIEDRSKILYKPYDTEETRAGTVNEYGQLFIIDDNEVTRVKVGMVIVVDEIGRISIYMDEQSFLFDFAINNEEEQGDISENAN